MKPSSQNKRSVIKATKDRTWASRASNAKIDLVEGLARSPLWLTLGWNDIVQRYRRSLLGPFWLSASMAILIISLGVVYAELFKTPINDFIPYLAAGMMMWTFMSSFALESGSLFVGSESYIRQVRLPFTLYVFRSTWSKLIILAHNALVYILVLIYFQLWPGLDALLFLPGLVLLTLNAMLINLGLGLLSARFRDIPQLVASLVQLTFFITPIMWKPELLQKRPYIADLNPIYHFLQIVRAPLLGQTPDIMSYLFVLAATGINLLVVGALFARFRSRIAYWV